jgi:hypothetical protein
MARDPQRSPRTPFFARFFAWSSPLRSTKDGDTAWVEPREVATEVGGDAEGSPRAEPGEFSGWDTMIMALMA